MSDCLWMSIHEDSTSAVHTPLGSDVAAVGFSELLCRDRTVLIELEHELSEAASCFPMASYRSLQKCAIAVRARQTRLVRNVSQIRSLSGAHAATSDADTEAVTASLNPRWLSDLKQRVGKCITFGLKTAEFVKKGMYPCAVVPSLRLKT